MVLDALLAVAVGAQFRNLSGDTVTIVWARTTAPGARRNGVPVPAGTNYYEATCAGVVSQYIERARDPRPHQERILVPARGRAPALSQVRLSERVPGQAVPVLGMSSWRMIVCIRCRRALRWCCRRWYVRLWRWLVER